MIDITADFVGITTHGKGSHTHQISNLTSISNSQITTDESNNGSSGNNDSSVIPVSNVFNLNGNVHIFGYVDVDINDIKTWQSVKANTPISNGKTIEIQLDDKAVDYHFGKGQVICGHVNGQNLS